MCKVLKVSASAYYYWLYHPVSLRELKEQELVAQIKEVCQQCKCRYGSHRISFELREQGILKVPRFSDNLIDISFTITTMKWSCSKPSVQALCQGAGSICPLLLFRGHSIGVRFPSASCGLLVLYSSTQA